MKLPLRLAKLDAPAAADAAVLFAHDPADLARVCEQLPAFPTVFRVAGGFLLFANATAWPVGVVKLRRLGGDLFVPADAELLPRLLPDEIVGLTRTTGLVVLVDTVLAFDPAHPLRPGQWLRPTRVRRDAWQSFPEPSSRAERLHSIERPTPPDEAAAILDVGRPDPTPSTADAGPPAGSLVDRVRAGATLRAGQLLAWVGRQLQAPGLGRLGGKLARKAVERVPRLTENILGAQEAALREVLRQLQAGDIERALKRAPIAVADPASTAAASNSTDLGTRDPRFSLGALLRGGGGGGWLGGGGGEQLAAEYRKLAEDAARRGDARRAAYLYGVLLRDVRSAANALMTGGFFREAGVLFRDKLGDVLAAAAAFERAGDYDEAVRLYEKRADYERAADLLRRIGDEDRAVVFFDRAAERLKNHGQWLAAGTLLRTKLGRQQPATDCYRRGWRTNGPDAQTCGVRCVDDVVAAEDWTAFDDLLAEAAEMFAPPRDKEAAAFFNYVLHLGHPFLPDDRHADVRDRVKLLFAEHLRGDGSARQAGEKSRTLFAPEGGWTGPHLRDAEYAAAAHAKRRESLPAPASVSPPAGMVTAVVPIRLTRDLLLAVGEEVLLWKNANSVRTLVARVTPGGRVVGLAASPDGTVIYVLAVRFDGVDLFCSARTGEAVHDRRAGYVPQGQWRPPGNDTDWALLPHVEFRDGEPVVLLARAGERVELRGYYLQSATTRAEQAYLSGSPPYLLDRVSPTDYWEWDEVFCRRVAGSHTTRWTTNVVPATPAGSPLRGPVIDWYTDSDYLRVVCVTGTGVLMRVMFYEEHGSPVSVTAHLTGGPVVIAACFCGGRIVAATADELFWLTPDHTRLDPYGRPMRLTFPSRVVFLAAGASAAEVLAVTADGSVLRVPAP